MESPGRGRRSILMLAAAGLALLAVVLIVVGLRAQRPAPPQAPAAVPATTAADRAPASTPATVTPVPGVSPARSLRSSPPVSVRIPRLGISSTLEQLGLQADGAMQVPRDPAKAGWFTGAPTPGNLGPAVITGHVTWDRAPAVFFRLGELRRGDTVEVARTDGTTAKFRVSSVETYAKDAFPTERVYGRINHAGLRLITCSGKYDLRASRYLSNTVAYAELVA